MVNHYYLGEALAVGDAAGLLAGLPAGLAAAPATLALGDGAVVAGWSVTTEDELVAPGSEK
jgi:hypothetical protein